jgi:hypothetical protein
MEGVSTRATAKVKSKKAAAGVAKVIPLTLSPILPSAAGQAAAPSPSLEKKEMKDETASASPSLEKRDTKDGVAVGGIRKSSSSHSLSHSHLTIEISSVDEDENMRGIKVEPLHVQSAARPHSTTSMGKELCCSPDNLSNTFNSVAIGSPKKRNAFEGGGTFTPSPKANTSTETSQATSSNSSSLTDTHDSSTDAAGTLKYPNPSPPAGAKGYSKFRRRGCWRAKSSMYRGVSFNRKNQKWKAVLTVNCKQHFLGYFAHEIEAARAYDREARM